MTRLCSSRPVARRTTLGLCLGTPESAGHSLARSTNRHALRRIGMRPSRRLSPVAPRSPVQVQARQAGVPAESGNFTVTVTARDTAGASGSAAFGWAVTNTVTVTSPGSQASTFGTPASSRPPAADQWLTRSRRPPAGPDRTAHARWSQQPENRNGAGRPCGVSDRIDRRLFAAIEADREVWSRGQSIPFWAEPIAGVC
jgi:hypothetical protein